MTPGSCVFLERLGSLGDLPLCTFPQYLPSASHTLHWEESLQTVSKGRLVMISAHIWHNGFQRNVGITVQSQTHERHS